MPNKRACYIGQVNLLASKQHHLFTWKNLAKECKFLEFLSQNSDETLSI